MARSAKFLDKALLKNVVALYALQGSDYVASLMTIPYLARVLEPSGWGIVLIAQSLAYWLLLVVEYGFNLSATRSLARDPNNLQAAASISAGVTGARLVLAVPVTGFACAVWYMTEGLHREPLAVVCAAIIALTRGFTPLWYFQAREAMRTPAIINIGLRLGSAFATFLFVTNPTHMRRALVLQAIATAAGFIVTSWMMYREIEFLKPSLEETWAALRSGWTIFVFRAAASLYSTANTFTLGLFVPPAAVSEYGGAEKVSRALTALLTPLSQASYPRISNLLSSDQHVARSAMRRSAAVVMFVAVSMAVGAEILAPWAIGLLLGPAYGGSVKLFRILISLIPLVALSNVLALQYLLPMGRDHEFTKIAATTAAMSLAATILIVPRLGALGMSWIVVITEAIIAWRLLVAVLRTVPSSIPAMERSHAEI